MISLNDLRQKIDSLDDKLLTLLEERMGVVKEVGRLKNSKGGAIYRPEREKEIIERLSKSSGHLNKQAIEAIFLEVFAISRNLELPERVAYLGPEGSYTHQAAESRFGGVSEYMPMSTISNVFKTVASGRAKYAVVPIENNIEGIVGETLDNLAQTPLKIVAEVIMPIHHAFVTMHDKTSDIKKIYSKDIAFNQCKNFLSDYNLESAEKIPVESTAKAAKIAATEPGSAAICSHIAAKLYGVPTLFENIEDSEENRTRFVILSDFKNEKSSSDKTSIFAKIAHSKEAGALFNFLKDFDELQINMNKIESRPIKESRDFSFWFFIEFDGHVDDENISELFRRRESEIKWLGSYTKES
jgi:chorismate mutase/prephenate dehydratase